ncbi:alpha/beta hydrolase [Alkalicoccus luteus]|uniref:Alpha/beta hydrolase n=1 Tax=Alkalicoccus luteus TaxID=1237094 RepID=A0A969PTB9_9BACI|nr:alpha/beta hydrolase [Alkalicoccus luteus]NJP37533.1 alpha/beta hydrolase [Alkalicoccus luteus]
MKHIYQQGNENKPVLLMLHGTGGTEHDLLSVASMIDKEASVLSVRGNVSENGMTRYFKRHAPGILDQEDLAYRTDELFEFIKQAADDYGFDPSRVVAVGYSNGANIAANLLLKIKGSLAGAILYHPMIPNKDAVVPDLSEVPVFIGAGINDQMVPMEETEKLRDILQENGANVSMKVETNGHQLTGTEIDASREWYEQSF